MAIFRKQKGSRVPEEGGGSDTGAGTERRLDLMRAFKSEGNNYELGLIGNGVEISGQVVFNERLQVDGRITGKIYSEHGILIVGETGRIEAQVDTGTCVIHGLVQGDVSARSRIEVHRTGRMQGDVVTPALIIEEGAVLNGVVKMGREAQEPRQIPEVVTGEGKELRKMKGL